MVKMPPPASLEMVEVLIGVVVLMVAGLVREMVVGSIMVPKAWREARRRH